MLSVPHELELKLARYIHEVAEGCKRIKAAKEDLYRQSSFDSHTLFSYLSKGKSYISVYDLVVFVR